MKITLPCLPNKFWLKLCVFNFFVVALLGMVMRYNLAFRLIGLNHKFLQQSHSHFAFYGWVSTCIYALVYYYLEDNLHFKLLLNVKIIMILNQVAAYGMLFSFLYKGYFWLSIVFSSLAFFTGFAYYIFLIVISKNIKNMAFIWLKIAGFFATFSAIGIFGLSYFASRRDDFELLYRASTYFYLHFQYNGFFLFSCIGFLFLSLQNQNVFISNQLNIKIVSILSVATFLGYGLSILWIKLPAFLLMIIVLTFLAQVYAVYLLFCFINKSSFSILNDELYIRILFWVFSAALFIKLILTGISIIPMFTEIAFNNINVMMAYLHLVLLVGISVFLLWKILEVIRPKSTLFFKVSVYLVVFGIVINEFFLAKLAFTSLISFTFNSSSYWLLFSSIIITLSIFLMMIKLKPK